MRIHSILSVLAAALALGLGSLPLGQAQTNFFWTNTASSVWGTGANWTNETGLGLIAPQTGGSNDYVFRFNVAATYTATVNNADVNGKFLLNQMYFDNGAVTIAAVFSTNLVFDISGTSGASPQVRQNSAQPVTLAIGITLNADTTFAGDGADWTIRGPLSGAGNFIKDGASRLTLTGTNSAFANNLAVNAGLLRFAATNAVPDTGSLTINSAGAAAFDFAAIQNILTSRVDVISAGTIALTTNSAAATINFNAAGLTSAFLGAADNLTYSGSFTPFKSNVWTFGGGGGTLTLTNTFAANNRFVIGGGGGGTVVFAASTVATGGMYIGSSTVQLGNAGSLGSVLGPITNNATLVIANPIDQTFSNVVSGSGTLIKTGAGILTLTRACTYTGDTIISNGTLRLTLPPGLAEGLVFGGTNYLTYINSNAPNPATAIRLTTTQANTSANWPTNSTYIYSGYLNITNASPVTWTFGENFDDSVWLRIDGINVLTNSSYNTPSTNTLTLAPGLHAFELRLGNGAGSAGPVSSQWWTNSPSVTLGFGYDLLGRSANVYTNYQAMIDPGDGSLFRALAGTLPRATTVRIASSATLDLNGTSQTIDALAGSGLVTNTGSLAVLTLNNSSYAAETFSGSIREGTNQIALVKDGNYAQTLSGTNLYSGGTTIRNGPIIAQNSFALGNGSVSIVSTGALYLENNITLTNTITVSGTGAGDGAIRNTTGTNTLTGAITLNGNSMIGSYQSFNPVVINGAVNLGSNTLTLTPAVTVGVIINGPITGTGSLTQDDGGTSVLNGTNTYNGPTAIKRGALAVNGSLGPSSNAVTVADGAQLLGTGVIARPVLVESNGYFSPGPVFDAPGLLQLGAGLNLQSNSFYNVNLNGLTLGVNYSSVLVTSGVINLSNCILQANINFTPSVGDIFTIITNTTAAQLLGLFVDGTTMALLSDNAIFQAYNDNSVYFQIHYNTGPTFNLDLIVVPEPSAFLLTLLGSGALLAFRRRHGQRSGG